MSDDARPAGTPATVLALCRSGKHRFSKEPVDTIRLVTGLGVEGDCHAGRTVQHLSRKRRDPSQPNLRQVHLIPAELLAELRAEGYDVQPGGLGENVTTQGLDVYALPRGARLEIGAAVLEVTGLRNPCVQIDRFRSGLLGRVLDRDASGAVVRRAGVMAVVESGGAIAVGDPIVVRAPAGDAGAGQPLEVV